LLTNFALNFELRHYCKLATLDYRCHVGQSGQVKLKPQLEKCLRHFEASEPEEIRSEFGLLEVEFAVSLRERARDLLNEGLSEALTRAGAKERWGWAKTTRRIIYITVYLCSPHHLPRRVPVLTMSYITSCTGFAMSPTLLFIESWTCDDCLCRPRDPMSSCVIL